MMAKRSGLRVAKRLDEVGFSDIVQIRNKVLELRAAGQVVHAFHGGEPFFDTPEQIKYALVKALVENRTRYAPSSGIEPLREALAKKLREKNGITAQKEDVLVTSGGAHALYSAFQAVLDPGDDMLLFSPYWTPIRDMVAGTEARALLADAAGARRSAGFSQRRHVRRLRWRRLSQRLAAAGCPALRLVVRRLRADHLGNGGGYLRMMS